MKPAILVLALGIVILAAAVPALAQPARLDAIWARANNTQPMTLDGVLNEPAWAVAESMIVRYAVDSGIPGSGWKSEGGVPPQDPTYAVVKLLVVGNQMWLGARVHDQSVGGSKDFNRFDGFLMSIKDHSSPNFPKPPAEYSYIWWYPTTTDPQPPGESPAFIGRWATWPPGTPRTAEQIANWDAVTIVNGQSNNDAVLDTGYTVEMRFNLSTMGYDVTKTEGDIVEWNISVYDCDWFWPIDAARFSSNRVWWQGPWANDAWYNEVRVYARPSVTISSGSVPVFPQELYVYNGIHYSEPVVDGQLTDAVWSHVPSFDIRYGDNALRATYPGVAQYRAGQFQATVNGGLASVTDPGDMTVKMFTYQNNLYFGFDVRDKYVQYQAAFDRWDGVLVTLNDRVARAADQNLLGRRLDFQIGPTGAPIPQDYLLTLIQQGQASVAVALKPGTTVDTLGLQEDAGWWGEMRVDLTALGYPPGLGDGLLFAGVNLLDGDSFIDPSLSYGTRTWWYREYEGSCCASWAFMDYNLTGVDGPVAQAAGDLLLYPNPSARSMLHFTLAAPREVTLGIFDPQGRLVEQRALGLQPAGAQVVPVDGSHWNAGLYLYELRVVDPADGRLESTSTGRMVVVR
jgi:hypothetical protein